MQPIALSIDELLTTTRNVRKRLDLERPVERAVVEECLDLALQAPNGSNQQSWEWVVVDDAAKRARIAELNREALEQFTKILERHPEAMGAYDVGRNQRMDAISTSVYHLIERMQDVPVLVVPVVFGRTEQLSPFYQASIWGSILPAAWSFMLALRSRGLGSAWTTLHLWKEREVAEVLEIPFERYTQAGLFPVAYTLGTSFRPAQRVPARELIRWNGW
jgi:nitroreductase